MKKMNKMIITMMIMAVTVVKPTMASNRHNFHVDKLDKYTTHCTTQKHSVYRPDVRTCSFHISHHANSRHSVDKAKSIHGVISAFWNPRTRKMTVRYDARVTSARHIIRRMA